MNRKPYIWLRLLSSFFYYLSFAIWGALYRGVFSPEFFTAVPLYAFSYPIIATIIFYIFTASLISRRLHDIDKPAWYLLLALLIIVPIANLILSIGVIALYFIKGTSGPNQYGKDPLGNPNASITYEDKTLEL